MTLEAWFLALGVTLPIAAIALLVGRKASHSGDYWTAALILTLIPLVAAVLLPWLAAQAPMALEPLAPMIAVAQDFSGLGERVTVDGRTSVEWADFALYLWITGAVLRGALELWRSFKLSRATQSAEPADNALKARVNALGAQMGVVPARVHTHSGPVMVTGFIHAHLYLNEETLASPALDQIIRHELAHIARRDVLTLSLVRLVGVALWFNPFLFAIEARRRLAVELDCDRLALAGQTDGGARLYARALLNAAGSNSGSNAVVGFGVAPRKAIEMRLISILSSSPNKNRSRTVARAAALGAIVALFGGLQAAQANGHLLQPNFSSPVVEGRDTSAFGPRVIEGVPGQFHRGHDVGAPIGAPVRAPADGTIVYAGDAYMGYPAWGHAVLIDHGQGWTTFYAHLDGSTVTEGQQVSAGEVFATVGNSGRSLGPHLHVEVAHNGQHLDPAEYLPGLARPKN